jgi:divalent metal cation (Fe/Co/Zn/Cd) transporter
VGYNLLEGMLSVAVGGAAGSVALVGFGFDSFVESLSGGVMIWRFRERGTMTHAERERLEQRAIRLVGYTFYLLAAYVLFESARKLYTGERPEPTPLGIGITIASLLVMPTLFLLKRRTAAQLESVSLRADARQTLACTAMSVAVLAGLVMNSLYGWWQVDALIGLAIGVALAREGREAVRGGELCCC